MKLSKFGIIFISITSLLGFILAMSDSNDTGIFILTKVIALGIFVIDYLIVKEME